MRQQQFDLLKGIGMILVLIGHVSVPMVLFNDIYLFHMPLFFLVSGCFFKTKQQPFMAYLKKNTNRLLVPYLFFLSVFLFFNIFEAVVWSEGGGVPEAFKAKLIQFGIGILGVQESLSFRSIWFLICLFEVTIIYWVIAHVKNLWTRSFISLVLFGVGYLLQQIKIDIPYFIDTALSVQLYYHLGYLFYTKGLYNKQFSPWISIVCIIIIYSFFNQATVFTDYRTNRFMLVSVPLSILIIWNIYNICICLSDGSLKTSKGVALINSVGINSLLLLGLHRSFYIVIKPLLELMNIGEYWVSCILVICAIIGSLLLVKPLEKHFPKLIGKG